MSVTQLDPILRQQVIDVDRDVSGQIRCRRCERVVVPGGFEIDHIIREIDSTPALRTDPDNLQVLCKRCHKRKSAQEAARDARRNAGTREYGRALTTGSLAIVAAGWAAALEVPSWPVSSSHWLLGSIAAGGVSLCTFLVQNGLRYRAPQKRNVEMVIVPSEPVPDVPKLDTARIISAVREIVGDKGVVDVIRVVGLDDFTVTYRDTRFSDHKDDDRLELIEKIAAKIGDRWLPYWNTVADEVRLVRRPALPKKIPHPGFTRGRPWNVLPVATGINFDLLVTSHLLVIGATNAGKTALMRGLIAAACDSASRGEVELILADPKQIELLGFEGWPGVREIVTETEDLWDMAFRVEAEMNRRYRLMRTKKIPLSSHPRWIIVIDEYEQYFKRMRRHWQTAKGPDGKPIKMAGEKVPGAIDAIQSILSMARRCGIHLIIGTQSPDAGWFGGTGTRENMGGRAAVGPIDAVRARMVFDDSGYGRDIPADLKGRTTIQVGNGVPEEIQAFWVPDPLDPENDLTPDDWAILTSIGMPKELVKL